MGTTIARMPTCVGVVGRRAIQLHDVPSSTKANLDREPPAPRPKCEYVIHTCIVRIIMTQSTSWKQGYQINSHMMANNVETPEAWISISAGPVPG